MHFRILRRLLGGLLLAGLACPTSGLLAQSPIEERPIAFEILVPDGAVLEIGGVKMDEAGPLRRFVTPALPVGEEFTYTIKATHRGKEVARSFHLRHGQQNVLDLRGEFSGAEGDRRAVTAKPAPRLAASAGGSGPEADLAAIRQSAQAFAQAFNRGDAAAIGAMFTANAESRDANGTVLVGRAAIEQAYADFFKRNPGTKLEVLVRSVRFPGKDLAVEEGLLRQSGGKDLPNSTAYTALHVRENGQWKMALTSESGAAQDRLEDLDWLLGEWTGKFQGDDLRLSFVREAGKPVITAKIVRRKADKEVGSGTMRVALDPETGRLRSWSFEDDGAHSQAVWVRDGKSWVLDGRGVLASGTPTAERIIVQRVGPDVLTWRTVDRVVGDTAFPDLPPLRLTRAK